MRRRDCLSAVWLFFLIAVGVAIVLPAGDCLAVIAVTVSPSSWTFGDTSAVVMLQADTAAPGNELVFDVHVDVDNDGILDPEDGRFMSFTIADGQGPHLGNEFYWHDQDGGTNSSVTATFTAFGDWAEWLFAGDFVVNVTDENASSATTGFSVEQDASYPCVVTGSVQMGGSPVGGAIVMVMDMLADEDAARGTAAADGTFELRVESPGEYGVYAVSIGGVVNLAEGSGQMVDVSEGANALPQPLVVFPGDHTISGKVFASDSGDGIPGVLVMGEAEEFFSVSVTSDEGNYSLAAVDGEWECVGIEWSQISRLGYVPAADRSVTVSGSDVTGVGLMCERATTLIKGTVKDGETQQGLMGIPLFAHEAVGAGDEEMEVSGYSLENGVYKIGVVAGEWWVMVDDYRLEGTGYAPPPGQLVTAPGSGTVSGIDFLLWQAGTITGHVYEDDGVTPVQGGRVEAFEFGTWNWVAGADTQADGSYSLSVPSGSFSVRVTDVEGFLQQYYLNTWNWEEATAVAVAAPGETSGIDFVLQPAAYITGHIYEDDGTTPIAGVYVDASVFAPQWMWMDSDQTAADGSYELVVPEGTYRIYAQPEQGWLPQYFDGVHSSDDATAVSAIEGVETSGIDFVLEPAATIRGHVYENDGVTPLAGAWVSALDEVTDEWWSSLPIGDDGAYLILVPSGSFRIWADADGRVGEYYDDTHRFDDAQVITVAVPTEISGIDFALAETTATITGYVYQEDGVTPLIGAQVSAHDYSSQDSLTWTETMGDGSYTLRVPAGTFSVWAWAHHWSLQFYDHTSNIDEATPVTVSDDDVIANINFELQWVTFFLYEIQIYPTHPEWAEVTWPWVPGMDYSVYWTDELRARDTGWHEVPDPSPDVVQEGTNGGRMTWTDKGTSPGMNGLAPGDPQVRHRFYRVLEVPQ